MLQMGILSMFQHYFIYLKQICIRAYIAKLCGALGFFLIWNIYWIFLLCATSPTFLKEYLPNLHRIFLIDYPGVYCQGFMIW
jgi:hypothetical protein